MVTVQHGYASPPMLGRGTSQMDTVMPMAPSSAAISVTSGEALGLRAFVRTEAASAAVLIVAVVLALAWCNVAPAGYEGFWQSIFSLRLGGFTAQLDLRTIVNSGLMTLFFLVVGLEARREFDLGDLRDRRRVLLPAIAGLIGMAVPVGIYLAINGGGPGGTGWGAAMSTDTALALGVFAVIGKHLPEQIRTFVLTVFVVDDVVALVVIAVAYSKHINVIALLVGVGAYLALLAGRSLSFRVRRVVYVVLGVTIWAALFAAGVDPVVSGLAIGLATSAHAPARSDLERATGLVRRYREQPSPELARSAATGLTASLSANARLQHIYHPWVGYVVVPLFGLANAGIAISSAGLLSALTSPITLGIFLAYVVGKPVAVLGTSWLLTCLTGGQVRPQVGWAGVLGGGTIAGMGFTVSLLIAGLALRGDQLQEAKIGILGTTIGASVVSWLVYRVTNRLPESRRMRSLLGTAQGLTDLAVPVDTARDRIRGSDMAAITVVEYGDFECPYCASVAPTSSELLMADSDIRYVWRHLPLTDVHPHAQLAAEAAEAAGAQGMFWAMQELLLERQTDLHLAEVIRYAEELGLDVDRFEADLLEHRHAGKVAADVSSADLSGVSGTPSFFINGRHHTGAHDLAGLVSAVAEARSRAGVVPQYAGRAGTP